MPFSLRMQVKGGLEVVEQLSHKMSQLQLAAVQREVALLATRRNAAYNQELRAYVDVCLHAGLVSLLHAPPTHCVSCRASNLLQFLRNQSDFPLFIMA